MGRTHIHSEEYLSHLEYFKKVAVEADPMLADPYAMNRYLETISPGTILALPLPDAFRGRADEIRAQIRTVGRYIPPQIP